MRMMSGLLTSNLWEKNFERKGDTVELMPAKNQLEWISYEVYYHKSRVIYSNVPEDSAVNGSESILFVFDCVRWFRSLFIKIETLILEDRIAVLTSI